MNTQEIVLAFILQIIAIAFTAVALVMILRWLKLHDRNRKTVERLRRLNSESRNGDGREDSWQDDESWTEQDSRR